MATQLTPRQLKFNLPEGSMINGKISPTVASNNLTVALKTWAGNDPSASDPVSIMLGGVWRSVTAALSHTCTAGTNWNNAGSAELATKEIDWFTFLGWSTVDNAVHIGITRWPTDGTVPTAGSTNEKGCNINGNMNAGDTVAIIGRFAATLSAGAGYTWSVPTFTAINLIQRPIYKTRWLTSVGTFLGFSSFIAQTFRYQLDEYICHIIFNMTGTSNAANLDFTLPIAARGDGILSHNHVVNVIDNSVAADSGIMGVAIGGSSSNTVKVGKTNSTRAANAYGGFTTSGMKGVEGDLWYEI